MLLVHQAGSLQVGQTVRYTLTYTPSLDRILPSPTHLYLKIKNNSPLPLRAAYLHGPYSLYVSAYPSTFNPNQKANDPAKHGVPEFEPYLKAGANWTCKLTVPDDIRESGDDFAMSPTRSRANSLPDIGASKRSVTWIIEVVSQVIFSNSASVQYEVLVGRDERSLELGFAAVAGHGQGGPGQLTEHKKAGKKRDARGGIKGVYSRAVKLKIEDTEDLWDKPKLPEVKQRKPVTGTNDEQGAEQKPKAKKQKVHLVVLTHGLHSNLSADMLYMKESIDATVAQAREERRARRAQQTTKASAKPQERHAAEGNRHTNAEESETSGTTPLSGGQQQIADDEDEEQVIVRGFSGNAIRTERGIQFLGKRLAKYVLHLTYPSQPFLPLKKSKTQSFSSKFGIGEKKAPDNLPAQHNGSTIHHDTNNHNDKAYTFTSISFVGHSLGGLVQLYAIAYIQKHAPDFFKLIQPVNFVCMASPLLGLSNENPLYVKFALDFGLVGRTGQDLGLTWRAPTLAKSGWSAIGGVFGADHKDGKDQDPGAKPLLRILPTGPAHRVLHQFRNRTVYSNVVNDGIVPLRTSCLLFLDWKGLDKVEKYRRGNGLIGTMAEWGWAELTGANADRDVSLSPANGSQVFSSTEDATTPTTTKKDDRDLVPQPPDSATADDNQASGTLGPAVSHILHPHSRSNNNGAEQKTDNGTASTPMSSGSTSSVFDGLFSFFRPNNSPNAKSPNHEKKSPKVVKALQRGQTISSKDMDADSSTASPTSPLTKRPAALSRGTTDNPSMRPDASGPQESQGDTQGNDDHQLAAPPRTSIFESASDLLHPPVPSTQWIIDPTSRPRTIFHDRVYHPSDIPPPPTRRPSRMVRTFSSDQASEVTTDSGKTLRHAGSQSSIGSVEGTMKVEEKIARAYHRDLSWRKVLVKLEPDAHNNMVVRRMFANAYGWPVVKHLCDTHFGDSYSAQTRDEDESGADRAALDVSNTAVQSDSDDNGERNKSHAVDKSRGEEVKGQTDKIAPVVRHDSELREKRDELTSLHRSTTEASLHDSRRRRLDSDAVWEDHFLLAASDSDEGEDGVVYRSGATGVDMGSGSGGGGGNAGRKQSLGSKVIRGHDGRLRVRTTRSHHSLAKELRSAGENRTPGVVLAPDAFDGTLSAEPEPIDDDPDVDGRVKAIAPADEERRSDGPDLTRKASLGEVGLRKDVNDAMTGSITSKGRRESDSGVSERVANATAAITWNQI